jgi:hypothetical protein
MKILDQEKRTANKVFSIAGVPCLADTLVVKSPPLSSPKNRRHIFTKDNKTDEWDIFQ